MTAKTKKTTKKTGDVLTVELPLAEPVGYVSKTVELHMRDHHKQKFARILQGARDAGLQLQSTKKVESGADLLRYLIEQVPEA